MGTGGSCIGRVLADELLVNNLIRRETGALITRARRGIRRERPKEKAGNAGAAQTMLHYIEQSVRYPPSTIRGHDTKIGNVTEAICVFAHGDMVVLDDPANRKTGK